MKIKAKAPKVKDDSFSTQNYKISYLEFILKKYLFLFCYLLAIRNYLSFSLTSILMYLDCKLFAQFTLFVNRTPCRWNILLPLVSVVQKRHICTIFTSFFSIYFSVVRRAIWGRIYNIIISYWDGGRTFVAYEFVRFDSLFEKCCRDNRSNDSMINKWQWRVRKRSDRRRKIWIAKNWSCRIFFATGKWKRENILEMLSKKFENFSTIIGFRCHVIGNFWGSLCIINIVALCILILILIFICLKQLRK